MESEVALFLKKHGLSSATKALSLAGYDDLADLPELVDDNELLQDVVRVPAYRMKLRRLVLECCPAPSPAQPQHRQDLPKEHSRSQKPRQPDHSHLRTLSPPPRLVEHSQEHAAAARLGESAHGRSKAVHGNGHHVVSAGPREVRMREHKERDNVASLCRAPAAESVRGVVEQRRSSGCSVQSQGSLGSSVSYGSSGGGGGVHRARARHVVTPAVAHQQQQPQHQQQHTQEGIFRSGCGAVARPWAQEESLVSLPSLPSLPRSHHRDAQRDRDETRDHRDAKACSREYVIDAASCASSAADAFVAPPAPAPAPLPHAPAPAPAVSVQYTPSAPSAPSSTLSSTFPSTLAPQKKSSTKKTARSPCPPETPGMKMKRGHGGARSPPPPVSQGQKREMETASEGKLLENGFKAVLVLKGEPVMSFGWVSQNNDSLRFIADSGTTVVSLASVQTVTTDSGNWFTLHLHNAESWAFEVRSTPHYNALQTKLRSLFANNVVREGANLVASPLQIP